MKRRIIGQAIIKQMPTKSPCLRASRSVPAALRPCGPPLSSPLLRYWFSTPNAAIGRPDSIFAREQRQCHSAQIKAIAVDRNVPPLNLFGARIIGPSAPCIAPGQLELHWIAQS